MPSAMNTAQNRKKWQKNPPARLHRGKRVISESKVLYLLVESVDIILYFRVILLSELSIGITL